MAKVTWCKWKDGGGPRVRGRNGYEPLPPYDRWSRILGVVARCEGAHDTVVMYDETGVTWGFMQWTFTSGRLQKLLQSFKAVPVLDLYGAESTTNNLFDDIGVNDVCMSSGFSIQNGVFCESGGGRCDPATRGGKRRIQDICMGRVAHPGSIKKQKEFAKKLARGFAQLGSEVEVAAAQVQFAEQEIKRQMSYRRAPLGGESIAQLLEGLWNTPAPALFFNLWQNHPGAAYRLFRNTRKQLHNRPPDMGMYAGDPFYGEHFFDLAWSKLNKSKFGNWGYGKKTNKSPRILRIRTAINDYYGTNLKVRKKA